MNTSQCDCPLAGSKDVGYEGNKQQKILLVGESPGFTELQVGRPFVGRSGELLRRVSSQAGLNMDDIFISNSARCLINKDDLTNKIISDILKSCRPNLERAIRAVKPKLIICCGAFALQQITKKKGITKNRGTWLKSEEFNCHVLPTFHPSYCLRSPDQEKFLLQDLVKVQSFIDNDYTPVTMKKGELKYKTVENLSEILKLDKAMTSVDTEGEGLDWTHPNYPMISFQISIARTVAYNVFMYEECSVDDKRLAFKYWAPRREGRKKVQVEVGIKECSNFKRKLRDLKKFLESPKYIKTMQNGNFDLHVFTNLFRRHGMAIDVKKYTMDIQAGAQLINENLYRQASLETLQQSFTDFTPQYSQLFTKKYKKDDMLSVPKHPLSIYGMSDVVVTRRAARTIVRDLSKEPRLINYFKNMTMPTLTHTLFSMEENGCLIDAKNLPKAKAEIEKKSKEAAYKALKLVPEPVRKKHYDSSKKEDNLALSRNDLIKDILFSKKGFGLKPVKKTVTGPSCDKKVRSELLRQEIPEKSREFIILFNEWKELSTFLSKSLVGFQKSIKTTGRIHSSLSLTVAVTGRISSSAPNLTNVPIKSKLAPIVRRLIIAPNGSLLLSADSGQAELRWIADVADEKNMKQVFINGEDIHTATAEALTGKTKEQMTVEELHTVRKNAKIVNFGLIYRMSLWGFIRYCKDEYYLILNEDEATSYINAFFSRYPGIIIYHQNIINFCRKHGYVVSPLGRKRRLPEINSRNKGIAQAAERQAINHPIQSPSSDGVLLSANEIKKKVKKGELNPEHFKDIIFIHDELIYEIKEEKDGSNVVDCAKIIKYEVENPPLKELFGYEMSVPLSCDPSVGKNLADMQEMNL